MRGGSKGEKENIYVAPASEVPLAYDFEAARKPM